MYWITNSQHQIKGIIRNCVTCVKNRGQTLTQVMGNLPLERVNMVSKPFENCAIDYAGPIRIKSTTLRAGKILKAYIAIFVCMSIKAIHIEPVSNLTAEACIAAIRRFVARRGMIKNIFSDNGTNFIGASNIIMETAEQSASTFNDLVKNELLKLNITWHFSPAGSPHFNGLVEAGVKSMKHHLKRAIGEAALTFEELATTLYQIEAAVNSRPLCPMSTDTNDTEALTPSHFLMNSAATIVPDENLSEAKLNWLSRWQLVQRIHQQFWQKWQNEYLHLLQTRKKWNIARENIKKDDLVLIKDENFAPTKWPMARVVETHPGADGNVRGATLKTANNVVKRTITKLVPLPINTNLITIRKPTKSIKKHTFSIITAMLITTILLSNPISSTPNSRIKIDKFESPPAIYYEKTGNAYITTSYWRIIAFFDMDHLINDFLSLSKNIDRTRNMCNNIQTDHPECKSLTNNLDSKFNRIRIKSDIIENSRKKRALLDIVGNLASDLFGVLDSRFAKEYASDVGKIMNNEEHLLLLIKNQTSVVESAIHIIKNQEKQIEHHEKLIDRLTSTMNNIQDKNEKFQNFILITFQISNMLEQFEYLVNSVSESTTTNIWHIVSAEQIKNQVNLMHQHVDKSLLVPEENIFHLRGGEC